MKLKVILFSLVSAFSVQPSALVSAATTIDPVNKYGWGANLGWMDWRGDMANGAVIGEYVCSGCLYAANVGWVSLGGGSPANGIQYQNDSATDYGVNRDALGNLRGYAYAANIGWINFESSGAPKVDLAAGTFTGYAWSANCGWISLSNAVAFVQTDTVAAGVDTDGDGIADAWERTRFGNLTKATASSDSDGDGMTDLQEYLAGTNPLDPDDNLRITHFERGVPPHSPTYVILRWTSQPSRFYRVERRTALDVASPWETLFSDDWLGWSNVGFDSTGSQDFYRVTAVRPLMP
jgi:hypothetical protein